ncbi:hypothetical protein AcV5_008534 [Taiwanofungus camphoratus]|nr:hypothetical protein AcV5_008534 [Antrodia cinnamomea]
MTEYKKGDKVEYRPVGGKRPITVETREQDVEAIITIGGSENVSHSTGVVEDVFQTEDGQTRYAIKNDSTKKTTNYLEMNIVEKI